jgi:hypothetical protein
VPINVVASLFISILLFAKVSDFVKSNLQGAPIASLTWDKQFIEGALAWAARRPASVDPT